MNSPYMGKFRISQEYKKGHTGLDLVGIDSKEIHSTVNGVVDFAGWENNNNHSQGFGLYVVIKGYDGRYYYYGHMSELRVKTGQVIKITDVIGIEGSTGNSTGPHCHYEIRSKRGTAYKGTVNVSEVSGIPNNYGGVYDDGYRPKQANTNQVLTTPQKNIKTISSCSWLNLRTSAGYENNIYKAVKAGTQVEYLGMQSGWAKISYEGRILYCGKSYLK